jgi:hypothetical protein
MMKPYRKPCNTPAYVWAGILGMFIAYALAEWIDQWPAQNFLDFLK